MLNFSFINITTDWISADLKSAANWALVILTFGLLIVTAYYAYQTKKIREIAQKPIFSFEIDRPCSKFTTTPTIDLTKPQPLYLKNYGPLARDIHIITTWNDEGSSESEKEDRFIIAMGTNQRIEIHKNYCDIKSKKAVIPLMKILKSSDDENLRIVAAHSLYKIKMQI